MPHFGQAMSIPFMGTEGIVCIAVNDMRRLYGAGHMLMSSNTGRYTRNDVYSLVFVEWQITSWRNVVVARRSGWNAKCLEAEMAGMGRGWHG